MRYPFGRDFVYNFDPIVDDKTLQGIPAQTPSIYLFTDTNPPTRANALAGTNSFRNIASWTKKSVGFDVSVGSINDPDPNSELYQRLYYISFNFILFSGGQNQTVIRTMEMERVQAHTVRLEVDPQDIIDVYSSAIDYKSRPEIALLIDVVKNEVKDYLSDEGFEWAEVNDIKRLKPIIVQGALMYLMASERKNPGDTFDQGFIFYGTNYSNLKKSVKLKVDKILDGRSKPVKTQTYSNIVMR